MKTGNELADFNQKQSINDAQQELFLSINSINDEIRILSDYINNSYAFSAQIRRENPSDVSAMSSMLIRNEYIAMIANQQNYLSLVKPQVTIISEQYNQFNTVKSRYNDIKEEILSLNNQQLNKNDKLIQKKINEFEAYFLQFEKLYRQHMYNWQLLIDVDQLDIKFSFDEIMATVRETTHEMTVNVASLSEVFYYKENMQKGKLSLADLQNDPQYKEVKNYIYYFNTNKDELMSRALYVLTPEYEHIHSKKSMMLKKIHIYYANDINSMYEKEYAHIPIRSGIQSSLIELEDIIKTTKQYYDEIG